MKSTPSNNERRRNLEIVEGHLRGESGEEGDRYGAFILRRCQSQKKNPDSIESTSFTSWLGNLGVFICQAEADMKKAAEAKNVELVKELEGLRVQFSDLQVNNKQLSQQVSSLQAQVTGE
ncbi:hypothetical protein Tco_0891036 [Tanacetum coccineum]|uniref:Uncharacterized protein n=1 Tax=Tanacetum coccineum TaxID=301880 RepID=A0ABQ5C7T1_9ASTR